MTSAKHSPRPSPSEGAPGSDGPSPSQPEAARPDQPAVAPIGQQDESADLARLRAELDESRDRAIRAQAELENVRKRARREIEDERRYADLSLISDLLPVMDNVGRAVEAAEKTADAASLLEGFKMMSQQLSAVLERHHCRRIEAEGQPFDPRLHQAILQQPSPEVPENTVLHVATPGYTLHDRVVRPAHVIVSTAAQPPGSQS